MFCCLQPVRVVVEVPYLDQSLAGIVERRVGPLTVEVKNSLNSVLMIHFLHLFLIIQFNGCFTSLFKTKVMHCHKIRTKGLERYENHFCVENRVNFSI